MILLHVLRRRTGFKKVNSLACRIRVLEKPQSKLKKRKVEKLGAYDYGSAKAQSELKSRVYKKYEGRPDTIRILEEKARTKPVERWLKEKTTLMQHIFLSGFRTQKNNTYATHMSRDLKPNSIC